MNTGKQYNLQIIDGNPTIHKAFISTNDTGSLFVLPPFEAQQYAPAVVTRGPTPHALTTPQQPPFVYSLWGPAGKGTYRLDTSSSTEVHSLGSIMLHGGWYVHSEAAYMFSRHRSLDSGFWIAVPNKGFDGATWEIWWLQPSGATVEYNKDYVMVDIEVVEMGEMEREKEL